MTHLMFLIPLSIGMGLIGLWAFIWTLRNNQYDDLAGDSQRVLIPSEPPDKEKPCDASPVAFPHDNDTPSRS